MVSGLQARIQSNVTTLASYTKHKPMEDANIPLEKAFGINTNREALAKLNQENEFSHLSAKEAQDIISSEIAPLTQNKFSEKVQDALLELTANRHQEGRGSARLQGWHYTHILPILAFADTAAETHAYFFLLVLLYILGLAVCVESIFFGEKYE